MKLDPLYRITFSYGANLGAERERLLFAEGGCEGRLTGRFRAANRARRDDGGPWHPDLHGAIETDDGATILVHLTGRGRPSLRPRGQVVGSVTHTTGDARYAWLNDVVGAVAGEVHRGEKVVLDVAAVVWEPLPTEPPRYDQHER